jgi:hypothetical protein
LRIISFSSFSLASDLILCIISNLTIKNNFIKKEIQMKKVGLIMLLVVAMFTMSAQAVYQNEHNKGDQVNIDIKNSPSADADATATIQKGAVQIENTNLNLNSNENKNTNYNANINDNTAKAINKGVTATNETTVYGDTITYPVNPATPLELPDLPQLPDSKFNVNNDIFGIDNTYTTEQLKAEVNAGMPFTWFGLVQPVKVTMSWVSIAEANSISIITDSSSKHNVELLSENHNVKLLSNVTTLNGKQYRTVSVDDVNYVLLGSVTAEGKQNVKMSLIIKKAAYQASKKGAKVLLISKTGFNIGGKGVGFNLFGTGVKVDSDNAVSGGGGFGPSYTTRYFDGGMIAYALYPIK